MTVISAATIHDHLDFLIMQPDHEQAIVRDLVFAVLAFNKQARGEPLQISFPLYADAKVATRAALGPCVRITGPAEKLYVLTLRYEVAAHLRAGRAMTLVRDRVVIEAGRNERFGLVSPKARKKARPVERRRRDESSSSGHRRSTPLRRGHWFYRAIPVCSRPLARSERPFATRPRSSSARRARSRTTATSICSASLTRRRCRS